MSQRPPFKNKQSRPHSPRPHSQGRQTTRPQGRGLGGQVLYGVHAVRSAVENPARAVLRILATDAGAAGFKGVLDEARAQGIKRPQMEILDKNSFEQLMPPGAVHQGIAAVTEPLPALDIRDLLDNLAEGEPAVFVMLDQVTDPHNVGAIIRSAAAFGAKGLIMQDKGAPELSGVLAKTASGAADVLPVALEVNLSRCINTLKEHGFFVIGLDERGADIATLPKYDRVVLVLGAEGSGLRRLVGEHCDLLAALPTTGKILSLNVSNAAAVALYAVLFK